MAWGLQPLRHFERTGCMWRGIITAGLRESDGYLIPVFPSIAFRDRRARSTFNVQRKFHAITNGHFTLCEQLGIFWIAKSRPKTVGWPSRDLAWRGRAPECEFTLVSKCQEQREFPFTLIVIFVYYLIAILTKARLVGSSHSSPKYGSTG